MTRVSGGVTAPRGFLASGVASGIKRGALDLALIFSERLGTAAGTLTTNRMAAHPVFLARKTLRLGQAQAVLANSGNANCCTGPQGMRDALLMRQVTADLLKIRPDFIFVASTGVIGRPLPARRIVKAIPRLVDRLSRHGSHRAAEAILTTDLKTKSVSFATRLQGRKVSLGAIAKGSGMIEPRMATMLCFITTDAAVGIGALRLALKEAVISSFNTITVDGQMSTNDMTLILANGAAGNTPLRPGEEGWGAFQEMLKVASEELAKSIVQDGEGATRLITVGVRGAKSEGEAMRLAKAIANAPLIKTMVAGSDPNWGRVAATLGAAGVPIDPKRVEIQLSGLAVFKQARPVQVDKLTLKERFKRPEISIEVSLDRGKSSAQVLSCDLTEGYVRINAKYS